MHQAGRDNNAHSDAKSEKAKTTKKTDNCRDILSAQPQVTAQVIIFLSKGNRGRLVAGGQLPP